MKVFLGGTCSGWKWRNKFQKMLKCDYYNLFYLSYLRCNLNDD